LAGDGGFKIPWRGCPPFGVEGGIAAHSTNRMSLDAEPSCDRPPGDALHRTEAQDELCRADHMPVTANPEENKPVRDSSADGINSQNERRRSSSVAGRRVGRIAEHPVHSLDDLLPWNWRGFGFVRGWLIGRFRSLGLSGEKVGQVFVIGGLQVS
jgi:hypothetical protein